MPPADLFGENPEDTEALIMRATYRALCEHGYADLTIQKIGDEFEKSKSLLYHHYDGKDELLRAFLARMLDRLRDELPHEQYDDPATHLEDVLDHALPETLPPERAAFTRAMVELRAQAAHDEAYREHFARSDAFFRDRFAAVIETGVADGTFRDVDPTATADLLHVVVRGAMTQRVTGRDDVAGVRAALDEYVAWLRGATDE